MEEMRIDTLNDSMQQALLPRRPTPPIISVPLLLSPESQYP